MMDFMTVQCRPCVWCNESSSVRVSVDGYNAWIAGALVQDAFPALSADCRELLKTGIHPECFNKICPPDPDDVFTCDDLGCCDIGIGIMHHPHCGMTYSEAEYVPDSPEEEETFPLDPARVD